MLKHYIKHHLVKPLREWLQGEELAALHHEQVPLALRTVLPALKRIAKN